MKNFPHPGHVQPDLAGWLHFSIANTDLSPLCLSRCELTWENSSVPAFTAVGLPESFRHLYAMSKRSRSRPGSGACLLEPTYRVSCALLGAETYQARQKWIRRWVASQPVR